MRISVRLVVTLSISLLCIACNEPASAQKGYHWTKFVQVEGQPDPVPAEWVSTPEGKLAHSIKLPKPLPKDSGYRKGMTSKEYFEHLCKTEAGEFIYKTVDNVEGFYFARPPIRPTDDDLENRYKLEAPEIERTFQLLPATPQDRAAVFVGIPWKLYTFVEEPSSEADLSFPYIRSFGRKKDVSPMQLKKVKTLKSRYGLIWRGLIREKDRTLLVSGSEWVVFDLQTREVLALLRNFAITGFTRNTPEGIYWLNAPSCPGLRQNALTDRFYEFTKKSLRPKTGDEK